MRSMVVFWGVVCGIATMGLAGCSSSSSGGAAEPSDSGSADTGTRPDSGAPDAAKPKDSGPGNEAGSTNQSFATATPVELNSSTTTTGTLAGVTTKDYFSFAGKKGERVVIVANAQSLAHPTTSATDSTVIDTVVTLYDESKNVIAQDDDPWPRSDADSVLFVVLPRDGTYYYTIEDCNSALPAGSCADAKEIVTFDYDTAVFDTSELVSPEAFASATQDGTAAKADALTYKLADSTKPGAYVISLIDGVFSAAGQTHVFSFTVPADTTIGASQRGHAEFWPQPIGTKNGTGSTANVTLSVTDDKGVVLSRADQKYFADGDSPTNGPMSLSVPVVAGGKYYLYVKSDAATLAPTDYYFIQHFVGSYYYGTSEKEGAASSTNDTMATAEVLPKVGTATPGTFIADGNLGPADVDWYEADAPSGATAFTFFCEAARAGSGLQALAAEVFDVTNKSLVKLGPEAANATTELYCSAPS